MYILRSLKFQVKEFTTSDFREPPSLPPQIRFQLEKAVAFTKFLKDSTSNN